MTVETAETREVREFAANNNLPAPRVLSEDEYGDGPIVIVDSLAGLERWETEIHFPHLEFRTPWPGEGYAEPVVLCLGGSIDRAGSMGVEIRCGFADGGQLFAVGMSMPTRLEHIKALAKTPR